MRDRATRQSPERTDSGKPPPRTRDARSVAMELQRAVGNRSATRILQRAPAGGASSVIGGGIIGLAGDLASLWPKFVQANRATAKEITIEKSWLEDIDAFAAHWPLDGALLRKALARKPRFHKGGMIFEHAGEETLAITLDRDVFVGPANKDEPTVETFVHELVHVEQYGRLGVAGFLSNLSTELLLHMLSGDLDDIDEEDLKSFHSSWLEREAYHLERRFKDFKQWSKPQPVPELPKPDRTTQGVAIKASVGAGGKNAPADVAQVGQRLQKLGYMLAGEEVSDVDDVTRAIKQYQREVLGWSKPDGRVDPGGKTLAALRMGSTAHFALKRK